MDWFILIIGLIAISLPLNYSFQEMITENRMRYALSEFSRNQSDGIKSFITSVEVELEKDEVLVLINIIQEPKNLNQIYDAQERLKFIQQFLLEKIDKPVHLKIRVFPIDIIDYEVAAPSTGYK